MIVSKKHRPWWLATALLALAILACGAPGQTTSTQVAPTAAQAGETVPTPTTAPSATDLPAATDTPAPDVAGSGGCTLNAGWVADVSVPDGTQFAPGTAFVKTWRVRNSGTCTWEAGSKLIFVSGDPLGGPASVDVPAVAPGSTTDIGVNFVAPGAAGTYRSTWQMQSPEGTRYGSQIYVQIVVPAPATATPTPTATPSPSPPDLVITNLVVDTGSPQQGVPLHIVATLRNQGGTAANNFHWAWRVSTTQPYIEAPGAFTLGSGEETTAQLEYTFGGFANYTTDAIVDSRNEIVEGDEGEGNNGRQLAIPVSAAPPAEPTTLTLHRTDHSGESSPEGRGNRLRAGIAPAGNGFRAFLDFDLSELPGLGNQAEILGADLDLSHYSGDCFEFLGPLHVYRVDYGAQIDSTDYSLTPQSTVLDAASSANIFNPIDVTARVQGFVEHEGAGHFQLRLQLENDDAGSAYACMMEWSDATLIVEYRP